MHSRFRLMLALALAVPLLAGSRPAGAQQAPQLIVQAVAAPNPVVVTWVDHPDGSVTRDADQAAALQATFVNTTWKFFDNNQFAVSNAQNGKQVEFLRIDDRSVPDHTFFFFHKRMKDGQTYDGYVLRTAADATQGFAYFTIQAKGDQGTSATSFVVLGLSFPLAASP